MSTAPRSGRSVRRHDQRGSASLGLLGPLAAALVIALIVTVDLGAYGIAVARAQTAADGGALAAAVAAHPDSHEIRTPERVALEVVLAQGATLVRCDCSRGREVRVEVVARMAVGGLVINRVWAATVEATAHADAEWVVG